METLFERSFLKDLKRIKDFSLKKKIESQLEEIKKAHDKRELKQLKKMEGFKNAYRIRIRDYRIGIFIEEEKVIFVRILHRKDIYNYFPKEI